MWCWLDKYLETEEKNKASIYKVQIHNLHTGMNISGSEIAEYLINKKKVFRCKPVAFRYSYESIRDLIY